MFMKNSLRNYIQFLPMASELLRLFVGRFYANRIVTVVDLTEFARTRAAFVAQTSLYGYLKTRMGTSFQVYFEDEVFAASIRTASAQLFVACAADLTVFAVATLRDSTQLSSADAVSLARRCYRDAIVEGLAEVSEEEKPKGAEEAFETRLAATDWTQAAQAAATFAGSGQALVRCAPVIDEYKRLDAEILHNSIKFRWRDIREQFRKRLDAKRVCADIAAAP